MELQIYSPSEDGFIKEIKWNHEEIKKEVADKVAYYKGLVYSDSQIKEAKSDRATLNKFLQALDAKRKEIKKQCMAPYEEFEARMKEIMAIVNEPISLIDGQIKEYEESQRSMKLAEIKELFGTIGFQDFVKFDSIFDQKWLNASVTMKKIEELMKAELFRIGSDVAAINALPDFSFEALEVYKKTLNVSSAIQEGTRLADIAKRKAEHLAEMQRRKEEQEKEAANTEEAEREEPPIPEPEEQEAAEVKPVTEEPMQPEKQEVSFRCWLSMEDATALKGFFESRNINFEAI